MIAEEAFSNARVLACDLRDIVDNLWSILRFTQHGDV